MLHCREIDRCWQKITRLLRKNVFTLYVLYLFLSCITARGTCKISFIIALVCKEKLQYAERCYMLEET